MLKAYLLHLNGNPKETNSRNYVILGREELGKVYNLLRAQDKLWVTIFIQNKFYLIQSFHYAQVCL